MTHGDPVFPFIFGMLACWQVDRNNYNLKPSIFVHTWVNNLWNSRHFESEENENSVESSYNIAITMLF